MSQEQPKRPEDRSSGAAEGAVKYGEIFEVSGELAEKPVAPRDAAMMQSAEAAVFGQTQQGGPAASMQAAATYNERAGLVGHGGISDAVAAQGVTVTEADVPGYRIVTESVGGQIVGQYLEPTPTDRDVITSAVTIGEALEATARTVGEKAVEQSDAAAIQAAEVRATGTNVVTPGGLSAIAQSAASFNATVEADVDKIKLGAILTDATMKLPADKAATREDAEGVVAAELRNSSNLEANPGGVAAAVTAAARLNEGANI